MVTIVLALAHGSVSVAGDVAGKKGSKSLGSRLDYTVSVTELERFSLFNRYSSVRLFQAL
jgi:hypothetical protein